MWAAEGKRTLNTYAIADFAYGKRGGGAGTLTLNYITLKALNTCFGAFYNLIVYRNIITGLKSGVILLFGELFLNVLYSLLIHDSKFWEGKGKGARHKSKIFFRVMGKSILFAAIWR